MNKPKREWGIAGHPRGATSYAAKLFGIGHENPSDRRGTADYLIAQPVWPPRELFVLLQRGPGTVEPLRDRFEFENKLTVVRDPWKVLATAWAIKPQKVAYTMGWVYDDLRSVPQESVDISFVSDVMVRWYRDALAWSEGKFFRAEDPSTVLGVYLPADTALPPTDVNTKLNSGFPTRLSRDELAAALDQTMLDRVESLRRDLGYE